MKKLRVLDLFSASQARLAGSASCRARHGKLDRVSTPCRVSCSCLIATLHCDGDQAYARHQEHGVRRMTGRREVHLGTGCRTGSDSRRGLASPLRAHSRFLSAQDCVRRTSISILSRSARHIHRCNANGSRPHATGSRNPSRIGDNGAHVGRRLFSVSIETAPCIRLSTTWTWLDLPNTRSRNFRNVSGS